MKYTKWLGALAGAAMLTSCVDYFDTNDFVVSKPGTSADYEYLNEYEPLKNYVDRSKHSNFKVSAALNASEFNEKGNLYTLSRANFDEVVAGNAMKMSSVVSDKGEFNYGTVSSFVQSAEEAGLTVYGHTLAWHSQQPVKWLSKLIADRPKPVEPGSGITEIQEQEVKVVTYTDGKFPFYPMGCEPPVEDGSLHFTPTGEWSQFFITEAIALEPGDIVAKLHIKASKEGKLTLTTQNGWSNQQQLDGAVNVTEDWQDVLVPFKGINCENSENYDFILKPEMFDGEIWLESLTISALKEVQVSSKIEEKLVQTVTYDTDGKFPFYPMGCEPPVENGALHFTPNGEWSQFFITNAIRLAEPGDYKAVLTVKASKEGKLTLTTQNGWSNQQLLDGAVNVTEDWQDIEVSYKGINCENSENYDFILKPEMFDGEVWVKSLSIYQLVTITAGGNQPEYKEVWTNEITNSAMDPSQSMDCFVVRDAVNNDAPATALAGQGPDGKNCLVIKGKTATKNSWDTQFFIYTPNKKWEAGEKYRLTMSYKASQAIGTDTQVHGAPGGYIHWQMLSPNPSFTTDWQTKTWEGTIPNEGDGNQQTIAFNLNKNRTADEDADETVGEIDYYFSDIQWESCALVEVPQTEEQFVKKRCIIVKATAMKEQPWDNQFWIVANEPFKAGDSYEFTAEVRADLPASPGTQIHGKEPGSYLHWSAVGNVNFTNDWDTYKATGTIPAEGDGGQSIAFNLNDFADANNYYFGNISFKINGKEMVTNGDLSGDEVVSFFEKLDAGATVNSKIVDGYTVVTEKKSTIPLTPEEKRDTLTYAMKLWIDGMMDATEGKVKAWDLINEAVAGDGNVNGHYDLQHFDGYQSGTWDVGGDAFYWQDYFGAENYGVIVEKLAREAYARQENANPADLKLFINDYNLESTWDDNKKLESLIYWIDVWEKGGAKIDGIGTQMHISYYRDPESQENQKKHITKMFKRMAETGKLVRVSELDMGIAEKQFGAKVTDLTFADEKAMADYYQWIIEEYFRIVPPAQQYGICQWCITDSPENSGWRAGEPVGLWYLDYTRKPAYGGWAEGLKK